MIENKDVPLAPQFTLNNKQMLHYDSSVDGSNRIIICLNAESLTFIKKMDLWIVDGFFRTIPNEFYQLHTQYGSIFFQIFIENFYFNE